MKVWEEMMDLLIRPDGKTPIYNCMLYVHDAKKGLLFSETRGISGAAGGDAPQQPRFQIGSITKTFTACLILQLVEQGFFSLDDPFIPLLGAEDRSFLQDLLWVESKNHSQAITLRQLLKHRSGLPDYFSDDPLFVEQLSLHPTKAWDWQLVMGNYFAHGLHKKGFFKPGAGFHYADTNYLLLAALIEAACQKPFHEVLEKHILAPLGLRDTYLGFYQEAKGEAPVLFPYFGTLSLKDVNTSFDWGGGGLVSTAAELDMFIRALFAGRLFQDETGLRHMLQFAADGQAAPADKYSIPYGLGLQQKKLDKHLFYGHNSAYGGMLFYDPKQDLSIILSLNQAAALHKAEWLMRKVWEKYPEWIK